MVLIFKTSVSRTEDAELILKKLKLGEDLTINFDLEDCDNILRVEGIICNSQIIIEKVSEMGYQIEELF